MTEVAQIVGTVALLLSVALNFYFGWGEQRRRRDERDFEAREWYKRTLFQHRLDAVHEGFAWLMKLNREFNAQYPDDAAVHKIQQEAREWYDLHVFYLESDSSSSFVGACNSRSSEEFHKNFDSYYDFLRTRAKSLMNLEGSPHD
jgi:hypothetical protein